MEDDASVRHFDSNEQFDLPCGKFVHGWHGAKGHTQGQHERTVVMLKGKRPQETTYFVVFDTLQFDDGKTHDAKAIFDLRRNHAGIVDKATKVVHGWDSAASVRIMPARPDAVEVEIVKGQTEPHIQG